jgi:O-antigen/teichoic acid export membrane protein
MGHAETITRNTGILFVGEFAARVLSFVFVIMLARRLGPTELGLYSFAFAIAGVFLIFSDMGLATLLVKEVAKDRKKAFVFLSNTLSFKLFITIAFAAISLSALYVREASTETLAAVSIVMLASLFNSLTEPFKNIFLAFENHSYYALLNIFERFISTGIGLALLLTGHSLVQVLWSFVISYSLMLAAAAIITWRKFTRYSVSFNMQSWIGLLSRSWPFLLSLLFMSIYYSAGTLMLTRMTNFSIVGWFNAAYRPVDALSFIPLITITAVFPSMALFHAESKQLLSILYKKTFYYLAVIALPMAAATTILAGRIITLFYTASPEYSPAAPVLQLLIWSEVFIFFNYLLGYLLNSIDKQILFTATTFTYLVINIALNYILIPQYSHVGVAAVAVITQLIGFIMLYYFCSKNGYSLSLKTLAKPMVAAGIMSVVLILIYSINLAVVVAAGACSYFAALALMGGIGKEELMLIKKVLRL